jgi:outer membrane receptor for ferrienterochelin and colicins
MNTNAWRVNLPVFFFCLCPVFSVAGREQPSTVSDFFNLSLAELGRVQVSIATGHSTPLDRAPATASVIYAAEITAMGARNLDEVLETIPGLHVALSTLSRLDSIYSIRGIHSGFNSQVLLLLNGAPVQFSLQGGRPLLLRLPAANIERVEIIRGPGSAIYGADAFAGVINVITKSAGAINETRVGLGAGSFAMRDLWVQSALQEPNYELGFTLAYQESGGDSSRRINADVQTGLDQFLGTQASRAPGALATGYQVLDTHLALAHKDLQLNLWGWLSRAAGLGAGAAQALDPDGSDEGRVLLVDAKYALNEDSQPWNNSLRVNYFHYSLATIFNIFPAGSRLPIDAEGNLSQSQAVGLVDFPQGMLARPSGSANDTQVELVSLYRGWEFHRLRFSLGAKEQKLNSSEQKNYGPGVIDGWAGVVDGSLVDVSDSPYVFLADSQRSLYYFSLQDEWQLAPNWELTTGVRYDDYSDVGSTTNPRLALVWAINEKLTSKLLYGSAFRAPSFAELHFQNNPISLGNENLRPERIDTQEWALNYRASVNLQTTFTIYSYRAEDMIDFVPDMNAASNTAHNAYNQDGRGFEWELQWKASETLRLSGNYSRQKAQVASTASAVADAPQQQLMLTANWALAPHWNLHTQFNWVADRARAPGDTRNAIDDYSLINLNLQRKNLWPGVDAALSLRNLANISAREPSSGLIAEDYPLEARSIWLGFSWSL